MINRQCDSFLKDTDIFPYIGASHMKSLLIRLYNDESAATAVEYAIIAALVGVASIFAVSQFGDAISQLFQDAADSVNNR
jgi:pilus assembly protein Flp/PilA